jgi:hypothetical protein
MRRSNIYLLFKVHNKIYESVTLSCLIQGHTHEDIDQMFSTWYIFKIVLYSIGLDTIGVIQLKLFLRYLIIQIWLLQMKLQDLVLFTYLLFGIFQIGYY